ncbi:undecaprenyl-phosphate glucose phosphotransferase [Glaciecola sp. MH2013]|uniref:undecaprenyl-phosphate glucose phosphotransferase n=1 Tax=Glaciecola sp. MH2013 TaxID=2785524 RepID=UPI00189D7AAF|nr:undecaprenyl-phosphate glucose phosphotransferase [Glaciecola sp. MH2013]MBF7074887.1 undecaprenyl-phosphate glucose phosphotransferase [Glaciecola sp. MH2013]
MKKTQSTNHRHGIIQSNKSSFSTLYRLVDLSIIAVMFALILFSQQVIFDNNAWVVLAISMTVFNVCAESLDLYRSWRTQSTSILIKYTAIAWSIASAVLTVCSYFLPNLIVYEQQLVLFWILSTYPALAIWRIVFRELLFMLRRQGRNTRQAAIIGATPAGYNLAMQINDNSHLGIKLAGLFDDREPSRLSTEFLEYLEGDIELAIARAKEGSIDYIYIAMPMSAEKRIMDILNRCSDTTCSVYIIPNFLIYNLLHARWQSVGSVQTLSVFDTPFQGANNVLKRIEDIILASLILLVIAIPMLIIALKIKASSDGPVIFKQDRYGLDGKKISICKFRTMTTMDNGEHVKQATKNDQRITPFGAFLRRRSLDELPQFFNVLQGKMSVVGPRPHAVAHNEQYRELIQGYMLRHKVKPGITGWAQINGFRGETNTINKMVKRVEYDLDYIHRWSIGLDIKIVLISVFKGFSSKNAV